MLCKPTYTISEWYAEEIKPEDLFCTVRIPLRHVGMGQMMALDPTEIEAKCTILAADINQHGRETIAAGTTFAP